MQLGRQAVWWWTNVDSPTLEVRTSLLKIKKSVEDVLCALWC